VKQLDIKDKQIEKLQGENEKLINSLDNITQSLNAAQLLHAGTMQKEFLIDNTNFSPEEKKDDEAAAPEKIVSAPDKKGFFKKLFGRN
jgi:hypothetical protein